jgi:predicted HAD superfamily phosphohydrolase YqeG
MTHIPSNKMATSIPKELKLVIFDLDDTLMMKGRWAIDDTRKDIVKHFRNEGVYVTMATLNPMGKLHVCFEKMGYCFDMVEAISWDEYEAKTLPFRVKNKMFATIIKKFNVTPQNVLVLDDCLANVAVAKKMGMKAVVVRGKDGVTWTDVKSGFKQFKSGLSRSNSM